VVLSTSLHQFIKRHEKMLEMDILLKKTGQPKGKREKKNIGSVPILFGTVFE